MSNKILVTSVVIVIAVVAGAVAFEAAVSSSERTPAEILAVESSLHIDSSRDQVLALIEFDRTTRLTPEQEAVKEVALRALKAPCCSNFSAATCCCPCNLAKATWGLAKKLIVEQGSDADQVRTEVAEWHQEINHDGFAGDACFNGRCGRAFSEDGCGGMDENLLIQ
jgi:hypothetical protein